MVLFFTVGPKFAYLDEKIGQYRRVRASLPIIHSEWGKNTGRQTTARLWNFDRPRGLSPSRLVLSQPKDTSETRFYDIEMVPEVSAL